MLRENSATFVDKSIGGLEWVAALAVAIISACLKADESKLWPFLADIVIAIRNSAWYTLPIVIIVAGISVRIRKALGNRRTWKVVQVLLDHYWQESFAKDKDTKDDPHHFHRVTMFKHCRLHFGKWPFSGWMVPVARSGHSTKSGIRHFKASLSNPDQAEGVAGRAFAYQKMVPVYDLPHLNVARTNDDDVKRYAEKSFLSIRKIEKDCNSDRPTSRSLLGIPVEVKGKPWGAIVLDSHHPKEIVLLDSVYGTVAKVLQEILR
jgi:hypothetical protein